MNFINKLLSDSNEISHKRFISIFSLFLLTIVVIASLFSIVIPNEVVFSLVTLIGGESAMTIMSDKFKQ